MSKPGYILPKGGDVFPISYKSHIFYAFYGKGVWLMEVLVIVYRIIKGVW